MRATPCVVDDRASGALLSGNRDKINPTSIGERGILSACRFWTSVSAVWTVPFGPIERDYDTFVLHGRNKRHVSRADYFHRSYTHACTHVVYYMRTHTHNTPMNLSLALWSCSLVRSRYTEETKTWLIIALILIVHQWELLHECSLSPLAPLTTADALMLLRMLLILVELLLLPQLSLLHSFRRYRHQFN